MSVVFVKILTSVKRYKSRRGDALIRCMVAFKGEDEVMPLVSPAEHANFIAQNRCLTINNAKKGSNTLTITPQSAVSKNPRIYIF